MIERLQQAEGRIKAAELRIELLKADLKDAKEEFDAGVEQLRSCAREMVNDDDRPLLKLMDRVEVTVEQAIEATEEQTEPWREVTLDNVDGIHTRYLGHLYEANVETVGELEDLRAEIYEGKRKWPKGIGRSAADQIEEAILDWLTKNRDNEVFAKEE
jgi:hypothetical protein